MYKRTFNPCDECKYGIDRRDGSGNDSMCKICEFSELLKLCAQPENEPLTLDELRQMNGEPVWTTYSRFNYVGWALIHVVFDRHFLRMNGYCDQPFEWSEYGKTWLAYRHKPKEDKP